MATGPYRRPPERPPSCARHADAPATDHCRRCAARLCDDCLAFAGARVLCAGCARIVRGLGAVGRALAVVVAPLVIVLPGLTIDWTPRPYPPWKELVVKVAIRSCVSGDLDMLLSSLVMHGHDQEVVAIGAAYAAACEVRSPTDVLVSGARARLAEEPR